MKYKLYTINDYEILHFYTVSSTMDIGRRIKLINSDKLVILADEQTCGRGRNGHNFISNKNKGLYVSIVFKSFDINLITFIAALSIVDVLKSIFKKNYLIKWPNDICDEKSQKICGILAEKNNNSIILGIGLNIIYDAVLKKFKATSLFGKNDLIDFFHIRKIILNNLLNRLLELSNKYNNNEILIQGIKKEIEENLLNINKKSNFICNQIKYNGKIIGLDEQFNLLVKCNNNINKFIV